MTQKTILAVDDEKSVLLSLQAVFEPTYRMLTAGDAAQALRLAEEDAPDIAIVDLMMPGMTGLELIPRLKALDPQLGVIVLSAMQDIPNVVKAIQLGALHFLTKPFDVHEVKLMVEMALREREKAAGRTVLETAISRWYNVAEVVGEAPRWRETISLSQRAAKAPDATVMLYGESGTGKELLARLIHNLSARSRAPMIPIHCAAIPETLLESELFGYEKGSFTGATERRRGCIEMADGGTLFLDEIGEMPFAMQSKLLRFLQDHCFMLVGGRQLRQADVRVVGATNRDLKKGCAEGWFREDLYYRLNVVPVELPPLRERPGDVALLAQTFLEQFRRERRMKLQRIAPETMALLNAYSWPGNVRELRNLLERATVLFGDAETLQPEHLPLELRPNRSAVSPRLEQTAEAPRFPLSLADEVMKLEKKLITESLKAVAGNLSQAAVLLQTTRRVLKYKIDQFGLDAGTDPENSK